ncbi:thioredoxin fold domain-containing protein [Sulfurospirillum arsenophilum]|uniref:thioredoxin fold domain-containing protein n=1 Tax=Sulfurospirillum arsenophilum TaxID=56698 RepID=UPI0005A99F1E|nr:thioredoxin fold domain-containing protein [Sulfurospirillum arsenophilum]
MKKWFQIAMMVMLSSLSLKAEFLEIERQRAMRENKLILLSVEKEGCPYCLKMQKEIFEVPKFNQLIAKKYLHVNIHQEDPTLPKALHVKYFPTNLILSPRDLKIIDEFAGYMEPMSFVELLDEVYAQEVK